MSHNPPGKLRVTNVNRRLQAGSVFIEFGLVLIPLLALIYLLISMSWMFFAWASLQEGVREGVRFGVTGNPPTYTGLDAAIVQQVKLCSFGFLKNAVLDASAAPSISVQYFTPTSFTNVTGQSGATVGGNVIEVSASVSVKSLVPIWQNRGGPLGSFSPWTITLNAISSDCMEGSPASGPPSE